MKKERFLISLFNKKGEKVNTYVANTLEDAECFAIAHVKAGKDDIAKQTSINEAAIYGYFQGKLIMYSNFKKEENS